MGSSVKLSKPAMKALFVRARAAGIAAGKSAFARAPAMVVVERANPLDATSPIIKTFATVQGGPCGYVWVAIRPGGSTFARFMKTMGARSDSYYGGIAYSIFDHGQSLIANEAHAKAFVRVLEEAGIDAHVHSRMD